VRRWTSLTIASERALEKAGVEFIGSEREGVGVRFRAPRRKRD
jgi:hypothetical protein